VLTFSVWLYHVLLLAYPASFRKRFGAEMAQVFRSVCEAAYAETGAAGVVRLWPSVVWDGVWAALFQWWLWLLKGRLPVLQPNPIDQQDGNSPLTAWQAGIAVLPFLAFGASSLVSRWDFLNTARLPFWQILLTHPHLVFNWLVLIGLGAGVLAGFPRWTYSFLGWALFFVWWWKDMGFYGYASDWRIGLPLLAVFAVTLLIRRSWQPLRTLLAGLWRDWTLLALGIYILYTSVTMLYDENHSPFLLIFIVATTLAVSLGAWGYFRLRVPLLRVLALMGGIGLTAIISAINNTTWDYRAYYGLPESAQNVNLIGLVFFIVLSLFMLAIGVLAHWRQRRPSRLKEI